MSNYDDVFHKKIASQDTGEVILFTKKNRTKINPNASMELEPRDPKFEPEEEQDEYSEFASQKDPALLIEFNSNNKIELVPKKDTESFVKPKAEKELDPLLRPMFDEEAKSQVKDEDAIEWIYEKNEIKKSPEQIDPLNPTLNELDVQKQILDEIKSRIKIQEPDLLEIKEVTEEDEITILLDKPEKNAGKLHWQIPLSIFL